MRVLSRLRWQLTLSHLIAIAFTLISMVAAMLILSSVWIARQSNPLAEPTQDAQVVANAVGGLVVNDLAAAPKPGSGSIDLSGVLGMLERGDLRVQTLPPQAPDQARNWSAATTLRNLAYIAVVGPDGRVLGSSDPSGAAFAPPERSEWTPLVDAAMSGQRDPARLVAVRSTSEPAALGTYPILDGSGHTVATVLVAETALPPSAGFSGFWHILIFFGAASVVVLSGAFIFALASSSLVGYLLSRRLVGRLERLRQAADAYAAGDLSRRVEEGPDDEVGQLARQFNRMAGQLACSVSELEAEKQHAQEALRAKRELVANVSHELRTPLASIRGHTESLLMHDADPDAVSRSEYLGVIYRESEHLSRLIDDLFLLSTAESGALPLSLQPVALGEIVEEVVSSVRSVARGERRVTIVTQTAPDLAAVLADQQRLAQVLANLVRNAIRHTPEGGLISVRASSCDGHATVTVEDTGVGISADQLPHLFERFYRGDASRDRASGGAGLGLAIVRELVEAMGGEVSAESVVGQGSRFAFTLPLAVQGSTQPTADPITEKSSF